eukprot:CAMPEP_0172673176 /NCGR_PEP_ID=MMETSP1074-20121228/11991_1 /TAXON_ID=2916 /ORGANISM="Ceratium fusus, Strain PA161109" /LENGTH=409 /DNA_ID=CAMNT_0013490445 /DNA_START=72 /DNA_END=1301 /DNA_ORIENTATION=-
MASLSAKPFDIKDFAKTSGEYKNFVATMVIGMEGHPKILRYDLQKLVRFSAFSVLCAHGTIFGDDKTAIINVGMMLCISIISCLVICLIYMNNFSDLKDFDLKAMDRLAHQINSFVPFCLGLYVSLSLQRWWTLRVAALGKVFDSFCNLAMLISCELHAKKWTDLRTQVLKYGFGSLTLLTQAARDKEDLQKLVDQGCLTALEARAVQKHVDLWQRPMILWVWIMRISMSAMSHQKSPNPRIGALLAECTKANDGINTINEYVDTQLPFAYVHLITFLVNMQNITLAINAGLKFATAIPGMHYLAMISQVAMVCSVCFLYQALLQITYLLVDPFGDDTLDFPIKAYGCYLASTIHALLEAHPQCPVVAENGTLWRPKQAGQLLGMPACEILADSESDEDEVQGVAVDGF